MANRIWNNLTAKIPTEQVHALLATCDGGVGALDFNSIIPMPKSMQIMNSSLTDEAFAYAQAVLGKQIPEGVDIKVNEKLVERAKRTLAKYPAGPADKPRMLAGGAPITKGDFRFLGHTACANMREYGFRDWYFWSIANWGTKWNADDPYVHPVDETDGITTLVFEFSTANNAPFPVIKRLSEMFPDAEFKLTCGSENPFEGTHTVYYKGGEKCESEQSDS